MKHEFAKYYRKFAWLPVRIKTNELIWLTYYYQVNFGLSRVININITEEQYIIYKLNGIVQNGYHCHFGINIE